MRRVLVVMPYAGSSFMEDDIRLLRERFDVTTAIGGTAAARALLRARPDVVLLWFAHPSYAWGVVRLARALHVRTAIVTGGYDVACLPEFAFGAMRKPHLRVLVRDALAHADVVLPFSEHAAAEVSRWCAPRAMHVVYPGVETRVFRPALSPVHESVVVTASAVNRLFLRQKGIDTFLAVAARVAEARFVLLGRAAGDETLQRVRAAASANVEFVDRYVPREEVVALFQRASVYVQMSAHEGFGLAAAEAMACGALVVGTRGTALDEVVGDAGELIAYGDVDACTGAVRAALAAPPEAHARAAARIAERFPLDRRARELPAILESLHA